MALTVDTAGTTFPRRRFRYTERETILYALGVGAGAEHPEADLPFTYEPMLRALPSQATVVAWDDSWIPALGLNEQLIVHGEQRVTLHRPLPTEAEVESEVEIVEVVDKGAGRGALVYVETRITESAGGAPLATLLSTVFARGDGGFGGSATGGPVPHNVPDRAPDLAFATMIPLNQALIYRLSGDRNPLHLDPDFARKAGFDRPILHGLSTYGVAVRSIVTAALDRDPARIAHVAARFTAPLFPGEAVRTDIWHEDGGLSFRLVATQGERTVLNNGLIRLRS